ncbi:hypothetical protein [Paenibacillus sp. 1P07SE]|uniref:hypothetical protein n=1 Tax=Paenibacillus sp. 1P07SE TaxID=3132209 RepID=UPI0039A55709
MTLATPKQLYSARQCHSPVHELVQRGIRIQNVRTPDTLMGRLTASGAPGGQTIRYLPQNAP